MYKVVVRKVINVTAAHDFAIETHLLKLNRARQISGQKRYSFAAWALEAILTRMDWDAKNNKIGPVTGETLLESLKIAGQK